MRVCSKESVAAYIHMGNPGLEDTGMLREFDIRKNVVLSGKENKRFLIPGPGRDVVYLDK